jgi:hypothetical protein
MCFRGSPQAPRCDIKAAFSQEPTEAYAVEQVVSRERPQNGRWPMTTFGTLSTLTAYLSLALVGAIVLGLI